MKHQEGGAGAQTAFDRRQVRVAGHQQTGRQLSAHPADSWHALSHSGRTTQGESRENQGDTWLKGLLLRRNPNIAAVTLANKNARIAWALLTHDWRYQPAWSGALGKAA